MRRFSGWIPRRRMHRTIANWPYEVVHFPANSPDLTPMDYGIWNAIVQQVPLKKYHSAFELKAAISQAVVRVAESGLAERIVMNWQPRLEACAAAKGRHFEA